MTEKMNRKKAGFTLVELMVVAIIVAILAAVAIPLMSGNKNRAMVTEAQAGCSTIATQLRMYKAENGTYVGAGTAAADLPGINAGDLDGTYFKESDYVISNLGLNSFAITATGSAGKAAGIGVLLYRNGEWHDTGTVKWK